MTSQHERFPWHLIDGMQIHEDYNGRLFTFYDLWTSAAKEDVISAIRQEAREHVEALRGLFVLEYQVADTEIPEKWAEVDLLFRVWTRDRIIDVEKTVKPEYKAKWEADFVKDEEPCGFCGRHVSDHEAWRVVVNPVTGQDPLIMCVDCADSGRFDSLLKEQQ